jgi:hypothetical protein
MLEAPGADSSVNNPPRQRDRPPSQLHSLSLAGSVEDLRQDPDAISIFAGNDIDQERPMRLVLGQRTMAQRGLRVKRSLHQLICRSSSLGF